MNLEAYRKIGELLERVTEIHKCISVIERIPHEQARGEITISNGALLPHYSQNIYLKKLNSSMILTRSDPDSFISDNTRQKIIDLLVEDCKRSLKEAKEELTNLGYEED